jgi:exodeoxyribonuclease VII large subunit
VSQPAFDFGDTERDDASSPTYTVGELGEAINTELRRGFGDGVWVRGEIDGLANRGPHTYFSLIERTDGDKAVLNVQLFAPMKRNLTPLLAQNRLELRNGMKVRIFGHLDFWAAGGRLGLKMAGLDPRYTLGEIAQTRDEVMRRIVAEGLLDANRQRVLSAAPLRVGVATSLDSAAWHDFHGELLQSRLGFTLVVADTRVQGDMAVPMVAGAIGTLARRRDLDAIVVIRGGGARNELAVFDAEVIARTIAAAPIPVLTGLGHEIDRTIADEVAHTSLKTPTACAGELIDRVRAYSSATEDRWSSVQRQATLITTSALTDLGERAHRIARQTHSAVGRADERLTARSQRLATRAPQVLGQSTDLLQARAEQLASRSHAALDRQAARLEVLRARVAAVDPAVQLARGWTITRTDDGRLVRFVSDVAAGDGLVTHVADGTVTSTVSSSANRNSTEDTPGGTD